MPQFTYDDIKSKIIKRERYKFQLNYPQQFFPIFKENNSFFDESNGYKRFLRLTRFYLSLPRTNDAKFPKYKYAQVLPKQVNYVKLQVMTTEKKTPGQETYLINSISPYNFLRTSLTTKADTTFLKGSHANVLDSLAVITGKKSIQKNLVTADTLKSLDYTTNEAGDTITFNAIDPTVTQLQSISIINSVAPIYDDELARNQGAFIEDNIINHDKHFGFTDNPQTAGTIYEFFGSSESVPSKRKAIRRPNVTSYTQEVTTYDVFNINYKEDKKHDLQLLSEIGLGDNRLIINLYENVRKPMETATPSHLSFMNSTSNTEQPDPTFQFPKYADYDSVLYLQGYNIFDRDSGRLDEEKSTYITGSTDETWLIPNTLNQYLTACSGYVEFEVLLVNLRK